MPFPMLFRLTSRRIAALVALTLVGGLAGFEAVCQLKGRAMADDMLTAADGSTLEEGAQCSLPSVELARRRNLYKKDVIPFVAGVTREDGLLRLTLNTEPANAKAISRKMAALEADCCSFMTITYAPHVSPTTIDITAPDAFLDTILAWGFATDTS